MFDTFMNRFLSAAARTDAPFDPSSFIFALISLLAFFLVKKIIGRVLFRAAMRRTPLGRRVIIVGNCAEGARAFLREAERGGGIVLLGTVGSFPSDMGCPNLGGTDRLGEILGLLRPDYALFAIDSYEKEKIIRLVNICDDKCVKVYFLPVIYGYLKTAGQVEVIGSTPLINVHSTPLDVPINAFLKRALDLVGSLILIILTSPVMLFAAIGVKLSSEGPVLFRQRRVGRMGREFEMLKFRSMRVGFPEESESWTTGVDYRKTRFGNFLRRTSIDELPQLFNVLSGRMSLVGPRPEIPKFVEKFRNTVPLYMVKHYVKPGITGLAQINGLRGDTSISDRIHADIYYIESWSFARDILILLKTPFRALNKREVYRGGGKNG